MNRTQTNIDKVSKPAATTTANAPAASVPSAGKPAQSNKKKHKKIVFKPNKGGMMALLALILIVAVVVTAIVFLTKGIINLVNEAKETTTGSTTEDPGNNPGTLPWNNAYINEQYANTNIPVGDLILVNFQHEYGLTDTITSKLTNLYGYEGHGTYYVIPGSETTFVRSTMLQSLTQMITGLVEANANTLGTTAESDRLYITDAYRTTLQQTDGNSKNPTRYPESAGFTEHHTGLAIDLKVMSKQATISLRDNEYAWLEAHCAEYGFVIRYDASKSTLTGIADEPYHFRYVGIPHATYMTERDLCLEEYLELIRDSHKYDQTPLEITAGEQEYLVYYVEANTAEGAIFTSIPVPPASEGTYTISGDNMNGFIVTVAKTVK